MANAVSTLDDLICPTERSRAVSTFPTKWGAKELLRGSQPHSNFDQLEGVFNIRGMGISQKPWVKVIMTQDPGYVPF